MMTDIHNNSPSPVIRNEWTANVAMIAAVAALVPILLVLLFASRRIDQLHGWLPILPAAAAIFLAVIGIGASAMALDGKLTFHVGVGVIVGYFLGVMALAGAVMIFLPMQSHFPWIWFVVIPVALLGVLSLCVINRLRRRHQTQSSSAAT